MSFKERIQVYLFIYQYIEDKNPTTYEALIEMQEELNKIIQEVVEEYSLDNGLYVID